MKHLTVVLFPILLILLSPTVLSQDRFEFVMNCLPGKTEICDKLRDLFIYTGEVIESNLVLNTNIMVEVIYRPLGNTNQLGGSKPTLMKFVSPQDQVERLYPTALLKQLNTGINFGNHADIRVRINSEKADELWFPGDGDIKPKQLDMAFIALHEMMHGLGFTSSWGFPPDHDDFITPRLNGHFIINKDDPITFDGFYETIFDANLVHLENPKDPKSAKRITDIAQSLNGFSPKGIEFDEVEELFDTFETTDHIEDAKLMLKYATTKSALAFMPSDSLDPLMLETSLEEFNSMTSICHFDSGTFEHTADFLMEPALKEGITLQAFLQRTGNNPGGGIGPKLRSVLKTIGYTINENLPTGPQKRRFTRRNNRRKSLIRF